MVVNLDGKDKQILFEIDLDARMPISTLAKKVNLSPQTTKYRLTQLERQGVIRRYVTFFDASKFGYLYYRLYVRFESVSVEDEAKIIAFFKEHPNTVWFVTTTGKWDLEILFIARNFIHFNNILKEIYKQFPGKLHNNVVSVSVANYHHPRRYLADKNSVLQISYGGEPTKEEIDETDKKIILMLNQDARISSSEIGHHLGLNYKTVQKRILDLEKRGIIKAYRTWIDFKKLGSLYYKILITLRKFSEEDQKKVLDFCRQNQNVIYLITSVWPWDIEVEIEAESEKKIFQTMRSLRIVLEDLITDYEVLPISTEHKLNYFPSA